jgi:hypothetical protein
MKAFCATSLLLVVLSACSAEKTETAKPETAKPETATAAPTQTQTQTQTAPPSEPAGEADSGVWAGQIRIDAHAGTARLDYVGAESGDYVPMRFRTDSEVGKKILATCADEDLCEFEGTVRFLDEPPPENASAVGEIVTVKRVKKLPPEAR